MVAKLMSSDEAIKFMPACADQELAISNLDGFHVVAGGYREDVDLLFAPEESADPSQRSLSIRK